MVGDNRLATNSWFEHGPLTRVRHSGGGKEVQFPLFPRLPQDQALGVDLTAGEAHAHLQFDMIRRMESLAHHLKSNELAAVIRWHHRDDGRHVIDLLG
jgi:hypothetical protein